MNKRRWMIIALAFLLVLPASMPAFGWDTIISFGDSLSDNGPDDGYGFGVASNGDKVWLDFLAESMVDVALEDRAWGGAQTDGPILEIPPSSGFYFDIGMKAQVDRYIDSLGTPPHNLSGILFTMWIGGNDFLQGGPLETVANTAVDRIGISLQALIDAGAEDILAMTMPDLGLAPGIVVLDPGDGSLIGAYTNISEYYNVCLTAALCSLRDANEDKNIQFYMADTFELLQYAVANGAALGVPNFQYPCKYYGGCDTAVFWDEIHPTEATHMYLAALALGQVKHGRITKEMKAKLDDLRPIQPRKPYVSQCVE